MALKDKVGPITEAGRAIAADAVIVPMPPVPMLFSTDGAKMRRRKPRLCLILMGEKFVVYVAGDIGRRQTSQRLVHTAVARFGGIDGCCSTTPACSRRPHSSK